MLANVEKIKFETNNDVVDYVAKGLPPKKNDYRRLTSTIRNHDGELEIPEDVIIHYSNDDMLSVLDRVYEDNCRNRNIAIGVAGIFGLALVVGLVTGVKSKKDKKKEEA